jgi:hypothetical protein
MRMVQKFLGDESGAISLVDPATTWVDDTVALARTVTERLGPELRNSQRVAAIERHGVDPAGHISFR